MEPKDTPAAPAAPPERIGPYRLEDQLGTGGMGTVYRAYDERLQRRVALKQIRPEAAGDPRARARFLREARATARLNHPTLVQVYDILEAQGCDWIVMELVEGPTLAHLIYQASVGLAEALPLALQLATGLVAAHAAGIVHRDLKPENVIVTATGQAKILDFGLAKQLWHIGSSPSLTLDGRLVGTPRAMSPEQALGREIDHRSDLFSLGILLYETVTGTSPFLADSPHETLERVCRHQQPGAQELNPQVPQALSDLIDQLLRKDPAHRPQTAAKVASTLQGLALTPDTGGPAPDPGRVPSQPTLAEDSRPPPRKVGERRQVTVLCCDLVSVAEDATALDPETLYEVAPEFQTLASKVIEDFEGHIGNVLGHRLAVYFGYPRSRGDDAVRAVRAAFALVAQVEGLNARFHRHRKDRLAVRVGIHSGPAVVVTGSSQQQQVALGETLDLATGVQSLAQANQVLVSAATHHQIDPAMESEELPATRLHGLAQPVTAYRVVEAAGSQPYREAETAAWLGGEELELLLDRFKLTKEGTGQVVLLSGETGSGKSYLVETLKERLQEEETRWLLTGGSPYHQDDSPALTHLLRQALRLDADDSPDTQWAELEERLEEYDLPLADTVPLLAPVLALPLKPGYGPSPPREDMESTLEALATLILEMAERDSVVLVAEDLQWADPTLLGLLSLLIDQSEAVSLLLILSFRLHFENPWGHPSNLTLLNLSPSS